MIIEHQNGHSTIKKCKMFSEEKIFINWYNLRLRRDETIIQSTIQSISMR